MIGQFINLSGDLIQVTIGNVTDKSEIMLADNPVTINNTSEGLFAPIKSEACTVRLLTKTLHSEIYSSTYNQTPLEVKNLTKNYTLFKGYVTPCVYSQDYSGLDVLEIEAVSCISTLKYIKYKSTKEIESWKSILEDAMRKAGYDKFYIADSFRFSSNSNTNILSDIYQFSDNFFDDDEEKTAWTYYQILEEFCKYFCLSVVIFHGEVYLVDYKNIGSFTSYPDGTKKNVSSSYLIKGSSYRMAGAKISYDETFNKINVKANLYEQTHVLPSPFDDLKNKSGDENNFFEQTKDIDGKNYTYLNSFFDSNKWDTYLSYGDITPDNINSLNHCSFIQKAVSYETEYEPSSLNWKTYITSIGIPMGITPYSIDNLIITPKIQKNMICSGGYFVINLTYKLSNNPYPNDCFKTSDQIYDVGKHAVAIEDTKFACKLYIGNYYYDGEMWINRSEYDRKDAKGYYKDVYTATYNPIPSWYKYKDSDGDWVYCTKSEYEASKSSEKETGKVKDTNSVRYFIHPTNGNVFIDDDYYNECKLKDRFWLVHKNKKGDKIYDADKQLTNTVSWRMNMVDSEDGVAIRLPKFMLTGNIQFELYTPDTLGTYPQYITDEPTYIATVVHISDFELLYKASGKIVNVFDGATLEDDLVYTNVINEDYVNDFDDLEIKVNTQAKDRITSLSSVLYNLAGEDYAFIETVYDNVYGKDRIQEESIIERYYDHYKTPKLILEGTFENKITPLSTVTESNLSKSFVVDTYDVNVGDDEINVKLIEL